FFSLWVRAWLWRCVVFARGARNRARRRAKNCRQVRSDCGIVVQKGKRAMLRFSFRNLPWLMLVAGLGILLISGQARADERAAIETVLSQQAAAWNRGDINAFMEHYWKSDELTFSSRGQVTRGWTRTKENYMQRYPTREQMGQLKFSQLEITS